MRNTRNGVIGSDPDRGDGGRLALDELIDQLLHKRAVAEADGAAGGRQSWHLTEIPASAPSPLTIHRPKACAPRAVHSLSVWLADPLSPAAANQFHPLLSGSEITSSLSGCGRKANASTTRDQCLTPAISSTNCAPYASSTGVSSSAVRFPCQRGLCGANRLFLQKRQRPQSAFLRSGGDGAGGLAAETRAEIAQNLWDEIGRGSTGSPTLICIRIY